MYLAKLTIWSDSEGSVGRHICVTTILLSIILGKQKKYMTGFVRNMSG